MNVLTSPWAYRLIRWPFSIVFLYAGAAKLAEPKAFAALIDADGIVPDPLLMPVAIGLPLLEVVAAIGLAFDIRGSLAAIAGLLAIFIAILIYGIRMGLDVDCGCFAPEEIESRATTVCVRLCIGTWLWGPGLFISTRGGACAPSA